MEIFKEKFLKKFSIVLTKFLDYFEFDKFKKICEKIVKFK